MQEISMLKRSLPKYVLERAGFVSEDDFASHDMGSRMQLALERIMPKARNIGCSKHLTICVHTQILAKPDASP